MHLKLLKLSTYTDASHQNLQRLMMLRWVMMTFLSLAVGALFYLSIPLHKTPLILAISTILLLNLTTWQRLRNPKIISTREMLIQLLGDIVTLTALFYFTGGYGNPFVWMYLLPLTIAAVALPRLQVWLLAGLAVLCYSVLVFYYVPLSHLHMHYIEDQNLNIHLVGMWLGFMVSAILIAVFVARIGQNLRDYDHEIAIAREKVLEAERLFALGTLAASAAHELGTPLSTMLVLAKELQIDTVDNEVAQQNLSILTKQIVRCKEILSTLTANTGQGRVESITAITIAAFLNETLARWQDTRPEIMCKAQLNVDEKYKMMTDRTLTQALMNLLDNAADANQEAGIGKLVLNASIENQQLKIKIRDYGSGIAAQDKNKLGRLFYSSKQGIGLGMGLYLTRIILARYLGDLSLKNHPDGGVLTEVTLPLKALCQKS